MRGVEQWVHKQYTAASVCYVCSKLRHSRTSLQIPYHDLHALLQPIRAVPRSLTRHRSAAILDSLRGNVDPLP
jgi:hypothetical protein